MEDFIYKISDRDTSEYNSWDLNTVRPKEEMIKAYRKITGACSFGVKEFVNSIEVEDTLSVGEVISITEGKYGSDTFYDFFVPIDSETKVEEHEQLSLNL